MSIYGTILDFTGEWADEDPAPILYRGSHILPSEVDERGGELDLGAISGHITRDGRALDDEDDFWPYLRLSVAAPPDAEEQAVFVRVDGLHNVTVILDATQVRLLRDELDSWLARAIPDNDPADEAEQGTGNGK